MGCASGMSHPPVLYIPGFRPFFLTSSVPLALFRFPLGGEAGIRDVPTSRTLHSRLQPLFIDFLSPISPVSTPFRRRGGDQGCPNLRYFAFPASGLFFLTSSVPLALFRLPLGGEGGFRNVPTSGTLHSRLPASFSWLPQSH